MFILLSKFTNGVVTPKILSQLTLARHYFALHFIGISFVFFWYFIGRIYTHLLGILLVLARDFLCSYFEQNWFKFCPASCRPGMAIKGDLQNHKCAFRQLCAFSKIYSYCAYLLTLPALCILCGIYFVSTVADIFIFYKN